MVGGRGSVVEVKDGLLQAALCLPTEPITTRARTLRPLLLPSHCPPLPPPPPTYSHTCVAGAGGGTVQRRRHACGDCQVRALAIQGALHT